MSRSPVNESCSIVQLVLEFHPKPSIRSRILAVLTTEPATGADVAARAGLQYKQTVDALAILYNMERVERVGAKCTARWCLPREPERPRFRDPFMEIPTLRARAARAQQQCRPYRVFH